jgi:hypothetical protein
VGVQAGVSSLSTAGNIHLLQIDAASTGLQKVLLPQPTTKPAWRKPAGFLLFRRICNNVQFPDAQACKFSRDHSNRLIIHSYPAKMSDPGTSWLSGATLLS